MKVGEEMKLLEKMAMINNFFLEHVFENIRDGQLLEDAIILMKLVQFFFKKVMLKME